MPVDAHGVPITGLKSLHLVDRIGKRERTVDRDVIFVMKHDEPVEPKMPGNRDRLLADALHEIAIGGEDIGVMIDDWPELRVQHAFGKRHPHRHGKPLAERTRRGLHPWRMAVFGMARRARAELPEALQFCDGHAWFAGQIEQRIKQHRAMAGGQDKTIAVRPVRGGGVIFEHLGEQHGGDIGGAHRQTRMTRFRLFHRIHGERANGIRHLVMGDFIVVGWHQSFTLLRADWRDHAGCPSSGAGWCKSTVGPVWQPPKGLGQRIAMFFEPRFNFSGRKNDFAATFAFLSRRLASILVRLST